MSLAARLSVFFLAALALVLAGYSGAFFLIARTHLDRQLEERLGRALDTLVAAVDIETSGLEWEPSDRRLLLGIGDGPGEVRWAVRDGDGRPVDRSANARTGPDLFPDGWAPPSWPADGTAAGASGGWRLAGRRLRLDRLLSQGRGHPNDEPGYEVKYKVLDLVVGLTPAPMEALLGRLALTLAALSVAIWATAATLGRRLGLRALSPLRRMAKAAGALTAADPGWRLPPPGTGDELDDLGRAFNDLLERLHGAFARQNEAYERQRRFAGDASHQLRNPLAALLGQVQVARRRDRSPEEYRRVLDLVQAEGERLRQIVDTLLSLAGPEGAAPGPPAPPLDLGAWLPDHLRRWSAHPRAADLRCEVEVEAARPGPGREAGEDGHAPVARIHPTLLAQLLDNLIENAFKYSATGTPVAVRVGREGDSVALGVADRGCGLEPEDLARVFEPFFRAERARRDGHAGVGLGLAVARRIADTSGGTLDARSTPDAGSLFVLRLPAASGPVALPEPSGASLPTS